MPIITGDNRLLLIDTTRTQRYIFASNRLRENVGASYLIAQATREWVFEALIKTQQQHNLQSKRAIDGAKRFEDGLDAELIYALGGNAVIVFRSGDDAKAFVRCYSRYLLERAPRIPIYVAQLAFDWQQTNQQCLLFETIRHLFSVEADKAKRLWVQHAPQLGVGVTVACRATGLPAREMSPPIPDTDHVPYPISAEISAKLTAATPPQTGELSMADKHLRQRMPIQAPYLYPGEFDHLGRSMHDTSYVAVVHADGDGIGNFIKTYGEGESWDNRTFIINRRKIAQQLYHATSKALQSIYSLIEARLKQDSTFQNQIVHPIAAGQDELRIELARYEKRVGTWFLPFRPIIGAGDDVTFVCDGRIGLSLATHYMQAFANAAQNIGGGAFTASAGVSIVRTHYPFARAYKLASSLADSAKALRRESNIETGCLDWHFTVGGIYGGLDQIRDREYTVGKNSLTLRPTVLAAEPSTVPSNVRHRLWHTVRAGIDAFQEPKSAKPDWALRRNKAKALREAIREGEHAVRRFRQMFNQDKLLPDVSGEKWFSANGYYRNRCGYFDALELTDWFIPLEGV